MSNDVLTRVWKHSPQKGSALLLAVALADIVNNDGVGFPGGDYLKDRIRMSARNTERLIQHLDDTGEIYRKVGLGRGNKTYYAVLTGLDDVGIAKVLSKYTEQFEIEASQVEPLAKSTLEKRRQFVKQKGDKIADLKERKSQSSKSSKKTTNSVVKGDTVEPKTGTTIEPSLFNTNTDTSKDVSLAPASPAPAPSLPTSNDDNGPKVVENAQPDEKPPTLKEVPKPPPSSGKVPPRPTQPHMLPIEAWYLRLKATAPPTFKFSTYSRYSKELHDAGETVESMDCAAQLVEAWIAAHRGAIVLRWQIDALRPMVDGALALCRMGIMPDDIERYVKEKKRTDKFFAGQAVSFDYVIKNIPTWKIEGGVTNGHTATATQSTGPASATDNGRIAGVLGTGQARPSSVPAGALGAKIKSVS